MRSIIIILLLCSCSPAWHLKQAERHIRKAEIRGAKIQVDTLWVKDTVFINSIRVDSIIIAKQGDTIRIHKDRLKLVYVRLPKDSIFIQAECEADTVIREIPITMVKEIKSGMAWWWLIVVFLGTCILLYFARK